MTAGDILDVLLPEAARADRERARRLATALRLLLHAGRGERAEDVECNVESARAELEARERRARSAALAALLHHHLAAHLGAGAFSMWGDPPVEREAAWRVVLDQGAEAPALPAPGEPALGVAARLLDALARLDDDGRATAVWSARMRRAADGPEDGERAFRALARVEGPFALRRAAIVGVAACLLERGRVSEARAWLAQNEDLAAADPEVAWHLAWCELCLGNEAAARAVVRGLDPYRGVLPRPLSALRRAREAWVPLLPGREPPAADAAPVPPRSRVKRGDFGASLLAVFALGAANEVVALALDVAPALRDRAFPWARGRDGAATDPAAPEHELVAGARAVVRHRARAPLNGALDPGARAQALVPVLFTHGSFEGEVAGWVVLELPHHLAPAEERLAALAEAWRGPVIEAAWQARGRAAEVAPPPRQAGEPPLDPRDPRARAAAAFVEALGIKTARRRWWLFDLARDGRRLIAHGGAAFDDGASPAFRADPDLSEESGGRALARAQATGGAIHFEEPDPRLSLHPAAASGLVVPVRGARGTVALFAMESERRRDFRPADRERLLRAAAAFHDPWVAARFSAWHRERFGEEILVDPTLDEPAPLDLVLAAGPAQMPVAVVGPPGAGKRTVARWLHLEGAGRDAPAREVDLAPAAAGAGAARGGQGGTWIVAGLDQADASAQRELLERLEPDGPRLIALLARAPLADPPAGSAPRLLPELARRLGRLVLAVRPLADRRRALPALIDVLLRRVGAEEALAVPRLSDDAVALLWRQPWARNVRELEALLARLVLTHPGIDVDAAEVAAVAAGMGLQLQRRMPSRHPRRADLLAALWVTRCASGSPNKTRAALYLGWDPDTLVARLREAHIDADQAVP